MNILITVFDLHFGGINNLLVNTLPYYPSSYKIYVVYFGARNEMRPKFEAANIKLVHISYHGISDIYHAASKLNKHVLDFRIDIIHSHMVTDTFIVSLWSIMFSSYKVHKFSTWHSASSPFNTPYFFNRIKYKIFALCRRFFYDYHFAVSIAAKQLWINVMGQRKDTVSVVYNVLSPNSYGQKANQNEKALLQDKILVTACRLEPIKGIDRLIRVLSRVKNTQWQLHVLGDGQQRRILENLCKELGIDDKVYFNGFSNQVVNHIAKADFYVNASYSEAFSIALLESCSVGVPIIASDVGGNKEIIINGENGFLVDFTDEREARIIFEKALGMDIEEIQRLGCNALKNYKENFSMDRHIEEVTSLYAQWGKADSIKS